MTAAGAQQAHSRTSVSSGAQAQDRGNLQAALTDLGGRYEALDVSEPQSIDAFLASAVVARAAAVGASDLERAALELLCARGLTEVGRSAEAEAVLRAAIASTQGASRPRALLYIDLAEACVPRREAAAVLDLAAQAEALCGPLPGLARDPEFRSGLLRVRCQAWIDLGRQERVADLAAQLAELSPSLPSELRQPTALQRSNALLALSAWEPLEVLAREELADEELPSDYRAKWHLRRGHALSEIARLDAGRSDEARREIDTAVESGQLEAHELDAALLGLAELAIRQRALEAAAALLGKFAARHPELAATNTMSGARAADLAEFDVEQRALFESLAIELALEKPTSQEELAVLRTRAHTALAAMRDDWVRRPIVPGGQGFLLFSDARLLLGQLARVEIALEGERVGIERAIAALALLQGAGTAARTLDLGQIDADRLRRELLSDDASLLVILPNSLRTHVFVLEPDGALATEGAPLERLEVLRGAHARWLFSAPDPEAADRAEGLRASGGRLRDALFDARVIAALRARPVVVVVGTDLLGGLPIEALDLDGGRAFGTERGIAHAPSLPLAVALATRSRAARAPGPWDLVVFGAPEHADWVKERWPGIAPVPLDESELRELGSGFAAGRVNVLSGPAATLGGLRLQGLESASVLQIVTHGVFDAAQDDPAGLVVSPDGSMLGVAWRADLRTLAAPRIVALWACGTQRGPTRSGDDTASHLGGAFLEANACSVLISRSDVALGPTLQMARRFARELARGEPPVEALRAARAEVAQDPKTVDPFFHAPIVLYGDPGRRSPATPYARDSASEQRAPESSGGIATPIVVAAAIAAAAVAAWVLVRRFAHARARRARA